MISVSIIRNITNTANQHSAEMGQLSPMGEEPTPGSQRVLRARATPLQPGRAILRPAVLPVLGFSHHLRIRDGIQSKVIVSSMA